MASYQTIGQQLLEEPSKEIPRYDSARTSPEPALDGFHELVQEINAILGPSSGIDSADVDVEELKDAMRSYASTQSEWNRYAFADSSRGYTRNLVDRGNGKCNLLVLVWTPGKSSPIHDHANAHCVMKILKGRLTETVYCWPCQSIDGISNSSSSSDCPASSDPTLEHTCGARGQHLESASLQVRRETTYEADQVTYMSDQLGLHSVGNPSDSEPAVSLHLYTPPNAAKHGCRVFDQSTGQASRVSQCHFYSEFGVKM